MRKRKREVNVKMHTIIHVIAVLKMRVERRGGVEHGFSNTYDK